MRELNGKYLVIGGAGFIGSHIVEQLLNEGAQKVVVYDNFARGRHSNIERFVQDSRCEVFPHGGDIMQVDILEKAMEGVDGVFHLAALWLLQCLEYPRSAFEVNVKGTFNVLEAAIKKNIKKVVFSSSASVYGDSLLVPMSEDHPYNNYTFYGATKIAGEHLFKSMGNQYGLDWVGLRYMNVYGERQDYSGAYVAVMHKILDRIEAGKPPVVFGDGSQEYDFISVEDVARANLLAMKSSATGECYNVGTGIGTTIKQLTELLLKCKESELGIEYSNEGQTFVSRRIGSTDRAEKELGFKWEIGLEEGMKRLIKWRDSDRRAIDLIRK